MWGSIDLVSVRVVELRLFLYANRKSPGVSRSIEIDVILVGVVEVDLVSVWGGRPLLDFSVGIDWLDFCVGVKKDLLLVLASNITFF